MDAISLDEANKPVPDKEPPAGASEPVEGLVTPHAQAMSDIIERRRLKFQAELDNNAEMTGDPAPDLNAATDGDGAPAPAAPASHTNPEQNGTPAGDTQSPAANGVKLLVNGQEVIVNQDQLIMLAQKGTAADQKFQDAARMREEAQRILGFAQGQSSQPQQAQEAQQNARSVPPTAPIADATKLKDIAARMNYGSEEEQAQALADIIETAKQSAQGQGQSLTADQVVQLTRQAHAQLKAEDNFKSNLETISKEYPEVYEDRGMTIVAADRVQALRNHYLQQGMAKDDLTLYREACGFVKDTYIAPRQVTPADGLGQTAPTVQAANTPASSNVVQMNGRVERKRAAPQTPAAATRIATEQPQTSGAPNASAVVQQMRKARHQPPL